METYMRGFSFMPNNKVVDLQYIEGELARTWRSARRERLKQREQKIWEEFVKEKDIVTSVCEDDQYQFLDQLPESYLKETMETELQKLKEELMTEDRNKEQFQEPAAAGQSNNDSTTGANGQQAVITYVEEDHTNQCDMFEIFDEEKDDHIGMEDGALNDDSLSSPPTVRERPVVDVSPDRPNSAVNTSSTAKSSENVASVIESSIYCAKVKDLRMKINDEILEMIRTFDRRDIFMMEREDVARLNKRSTEFCSRFNRIYMYQLQRQMHDIKRHNNLTLPFAKHTQFQSQMIRVASLHQNLLQAFQVFHKAVHQTWGGRDSESALRALVGAVRTTTAYCIALAHPTDLSAASQLYNDNLLTLCDKLEEFLKEYTVRCEECLNGVVNVDDKKKVHNQIQKKTKKHTISQRNGPKWRSEGRLSMYSLDTLRVNTKTSTFKDNQFGGTSRTRHSIYSTNKTNVVDKSEQPPKSHRKSPRRPLMRDPQAGRPRPPRGPRPPRVRDYDVCTMVEQIKPCVSSHGSREASPCAGTHRIKSDTPHKETHHIARKLDTSRRSQTSKSSTSLSPKIESPLNKIPNNKKDTETAKLIPVGRVQSAKKKGTTKDDKNRESKADTPENKMPLKSRLSQLGSPVVETSKTAVPNHASLTRQAQKQVLPGQSSEPPETPTGENKEKNRNKGTKSAEQNEVSKLLKQLCSGDAAGCNNRTESTSNAKNAQLLYMRSDSPRSQPNTPHLLQILEETIHKKVPESLLQNYEQCDVDKFRMNLNIEEKVVDNLFQYRTKFVQHMLNSSMYANSAVGKPWEMIESVAERIIDEILLSCVKEMELNDILQQLYERETCVQN